MRIPMRAFRVYLRPRFFLRGLLFGLFYICSLVMVNQIYTAYNSITIGQHQPYPTHLSVAFETKEPPLTYNLMEETYGKKWAKKVDKYLSSIDCTVEYVNQNKLQQDHPCVIHLIQKTYLRQPAPRSLPYQLGHPLLVDPSDGQAKGILGILRNQTNGFFIECGAYDGETLSNTLYMERWLNWTGLLIEADQLSYKELIKRNRKAYASSVCLSTKPYPMEVIFNATTGTLGAIVERNDEESITSSATRKNDRQRDETGDKSQLSHLYKVQCFPLYSLLIALGRTQVDYFSLDVEGSELHVLKTIPWHKVDIRTLTVEWNHVPEGEAALTRLMESNQFVKFGQIAMEFSDEVVYVKDFLADLRQYENF